MRVIFLDIDGVLVLWRTATFEPGPATELCRIIEATGAKIVISSTWRENSELMRRFLEQAEEHGIPAPIGYTPCLGESFTPPTDFGDTPSPGDDEWEDGERMESERPAEIAAWLAAHPEVTQFAIIDDIDYGFETSFFQIRYAEGLTREIADRVIDHFERGNR